MSRVRILVAIYTNPAAYPPVERLVTYLRRRGGVVRLLGAQGLETDAITSSRLAAVDARMASRTGSGVAVQLRYAWFLLWACAHLVRFRPRWVHLSDPWTAPIGLLALKLRRRVVYQEHDTPTEEPRTRSARVIAAARRSLLAEADLVVTPNAERSRLLSEQGGGRDVLTVWNCPMLDEVRCPIRVAGGRLRLVYQGSIVPGRPPLALVDAMAASGVNPILQLVGYETVGSRGYVKALQERSRHLGLQDSVVHLAALSREETLDQAARGDLGIALMPVPGTNFNERAMVGASNKVFEYLACGVPALVSDEPRWRETFVATGVALVADPNNVSSLAAALRWAASHRDELAAMGARGRRWIEEAWNFETVFTPVARRIFGAEDAG